jgi:copper chaperone
MESKVLRIDGMQCNHCIMAVKGAIENNGAENVVVSLKDKTAKFDFDPSKAKLDSIIKAIEDSGFDVIK